MGSYLLKDEMSTCDLELPMEAYSLLMNVCASLQHYCVDLIDVGEIRAPPLSGCCWSCYVLSVGRDCGYIPIEMHNDFANRAWAAVRHY